MTAKDRYIASNDWRGSYVEPERVNKADQLGHATGCRCLECWSHDVFMRFCDDIDRLAANAGRGSQDRGKDAGPRPSETEDKP